MTQVLAICASDLHLDDRTHDSVPTFRSTEPDWFAAQKRPLDEIAALKEKHGCPVLYAGDITNRPDVSAECINFLIRCLPKGYAVPGQHDLKHHRLEDVHKTAYQVLVEAGVLIDLPYNVPVSVGQLRLWGFPWKAKPFPMPYENHSLAWDVAVIHRYVWTKGTGYEHAPEDARLKHLWPKLAGYDAIICGDNHCGFVNNWLCNCGCLTRRSVTELAYEPSVWLLHSDGTFERHLLDVSQDKYLIEAKPDKPKPDNKLDAAEFMKGLGGLSESRIDFETEVKQEAERRKTSAGAMNVVTKAMGKS